MATLLRRYLPEGLLDSVVAAARSEAGNAFKPRFHPDVAAELLFQIQKERFKKDPDVAGATLHSSVLQSICHNYKQYFDLFERCGAVEADRQYVVGITARRYQFHPLRADAVSLQRHSLTKKSLINRANKLTEQQRNAYPEVFAGLDSLWFNFDGASEWVRQSGGSTARQACLLAQFELIHDRAFYVAEDKNGRRHHNLTNIPRFVRKDFFQFQTETRREACVEVDWSSSQPCCLIKLLQTYDVDYSEVLKWAFYVEKLGIYRLFANQHCRGYSEERFKKEIFLPFLFDRPRDSRKDRMTAVFQRKMPNSLRLMNDLKHEFGASYLANALQRIESNLMYRMVIPRLISARMPVVPIHDGVLVPASRAIEAQGIFEAALKEHFRVGRFGVGKAKIKADGSAVLPPPPSSPSLC